MVQCRSVKATNVVDSQETEYTSAKINVPPPPGKASDREAEFVRLPPPKGRCPLTGLSRTTLSELIEGGHIKAVKLRKRGAIRGITLVVRKSLIDYLYGLAK